MDTINSLQQLTQTSSNYLQDYIPSVITTTTTTDFIPDVNKLTSTNQLVGDEITNTTDGSSDVVPSLAETALIEAATELKKTDVKFTKKEFSKLTINQIYDNTIKTMIAIINDISELISEKEVMTNTEFRRKLVEIFFMKERRMYVGILLILVSFILYFIDSST